MDRLVTKFFEAKQPAWSMFHIPAFMRHYKMFWEGTGYRNYTFVGMVFVMCSHAALYSHMGGEELPGNMGSARAYIPSPFFPLSVCLGSSTGSRGSRDS